MGYEYKLGSVVTDLGEERVIGYQPVFAVPPGDGGAPSDGVWITGQIAVRGIILPTPGTAGQCAAEPPTWPRWIRFCLIVWLFCLGAVFGLLMAALFRGG